MALCPMALGVQSHLLGGGGRASRPWTEPPQKNVGHQVSAKPSLSHLPAPLYQTLWASGGPLGMGTPFVLGSLAD